MRSPPKGIWRDLARRFPMRTPLPQLAEPVAERRGVDERVLSLTFDDGPSRWTAAILDVLRDHGARATFFVIGEAVAGNEWIVQRAYAEGHEIGNHTMR